jgi:Ca2+-binding EF-hand superfamily protein
LHFTEPLTVLDKKVIEAFMVFDHTNSNTVDVREVGTIIRSLGKLILVLESTVDVM